MCGCAIHLEPEKETPSQPKNQGSHKAYAIRRPPACVRCENRQIRPSVTRECHIMTMTVCQTSRTVS